MKGRSDLSSNFNRAPMVRWYINIMIVIIIIVAVFVVIVNWLNTLLLTPCGQSL